MSGNYRTRTAKEVRAAAIMRVGEIAGYDERLSPTLVMARPLAAKRLVNKALMEAAGDPDLLDEVRALGPIVKGQSDAVLDAVHAPDDPNRPATLTDWTDALNAWEGAA